MPLTNSQYNELMRRYSRTRFKHQHEMEEKLRHIYAQCPRLMEISQLLPAASSRAAKASILNDSEAAVRAEKEVHSLRRERDELLASLNYTLSDLQPKYTCPDCKDTGYIRLNKKCHCFEQTGISLLYEQSGLHNRLDKENFSVFNAELYSDVPNPFLGGRSNRLHMQQLKLRSENYAHQFTEASSNLLIFGSTGVGKTFLCNCIAKVVLDRGFSVLYMTAPELFESAIQKLNADSYDTEFNLNDYVLECSLLIIDDLGSETKSPFKNSYLFNIINSRFVSGKPTIISTNLNPDELQERYSERISSRLTGFYTVIPIFGDDLRNT